MSARVLWPQAPLKQWRARLRFFFMQSLAGMRIAELFDILVDFPDSTPALDDLHALLLRTPPPLLPPPC